MDNTEKLREVFAESLGVEKDVITDTLEYNSIPQWDSIAHMRLIGALEIAFDVMIDTDDVIDMSSLAKARKILKKYGVDL